MWRHLLLVAALVGLSACSTFGRFFGGTDPARVPSSAGESESGYTYIPIDPFPVAEVAGDSCKESSRGQSSAMTLLEALPDNAVRMLVEQFDLSGGVTYGSSKTAAKGESYRVTVDYINADTINFPVAIKKQMRSKKKDGVMEPVDLFGTPSEDVEPGTETYSVTRVDPAMTRSADRDIFNIPVYVGVGLRVSANVYVVGANANISGIGVIGAEAEAERVRGSLIVQTLGVNGKSVAAALPIQSELNRTTAQNAIVSVGSIKALLYAEETAKSPRVVGIYLPFPGGKPLVNAIISELSRERVEWPRPCLLKTQLAMGERP